MAILEENFNENQLALIQSGVQDNIFVTEFDEERGDYVRVNVFDDNERYIGTLTSNKLKSIKTIAENIIPQEVTEETQVQLYRDLLTKKIFIKPNEIFSYMELEEGNYIIKCDFLRNTMIELQGCTDNRTPADASIQMDGFFDIFGNASCGVLANEMCVAKNYDPSAAADDGSCEYRTSPGIEPGPDQPGVQG